LVSVSLACGPLKVSVTLCHCRSSPETTAAPEPPPCRAPPAETPARTNRAALTSVPLIILSSGGLRPAGPPNALARGDPCDPRSARAAHSLRSFLAFSSHTNWLRVQL